MLEIIEKLLVLQDRDRQIIRAEAELERVDPEKQLSQRKCAGTVKALDDAREQSKIVEAARKDLQLEVESFNVKIAKYSNQQLQTKKNEEYQALTNEINGCKAKISDLETGILENMDAAEAATKAGKAAKAEAEKVVKIVAEQVVNLDALGATLESRLVELDGERDKLAEGVEARLLRSYDRVLNLRGENVVVGIEHSVCGGCHMKLTAQVIVSAKGQQEIVNCPHCSRILFFTADMDMEAAADAGPGNSF
jgi:predicted  nucleic acid-binding Zn-ribbon protein